MSSETLLLTLTQQVSIRIVQSKDGRVMNRQLLSGPDLPGKTLSPEHEHPGKSGSDRTVNSAAARYYCGVLFQLHSDIL